MTLLMTTGSLTIAAGAVIFLVITLILVGALLAAKAKLVPSGNVDLKVNGEKDIETPIGSTLLAGLQSGGIFLSSACGGGGKCGQCRAQVLEGGGEILPTEKGFFSRKQIKEHWRLACQCKVKEDMVVQVPDEVFGVKEWECEVISNKNVATFIKEFIVALPKGEHMDFLPGSYAQIKIPAYAMDYNKDIDKSLIGEEYLPEFYHFFDAMRQNIEIFLRVGEEDEEQIHEILERDWEKAHAPLVGVQCYDFQGSHPEAEAGTCVYFANLLTEIGRFFEPMSMLGVL